MINKYIAIIALDNDYDRYGVIFVPFQTQYTIVEILREQKLRIDNLNKANKQDCDYDVNKWLAARDYFSFYSGSKSLPILDTGIQLISECHPILDIVTIQEWFTRYATGPIETRDDVDKKISSQYTNK